MTRTKNFANVWDAINKFSFDTLLVLATRAGLEVKSDVGSAT
jgi:hypothetical protein